MTLHRVIGKHCIFNYLLQDNVKRSVKHYYFTLWADHGVPSDASGLIKFCKVIRSERQKPGGTIVVHCR